LNGLSIRCYKDPFGFSVLMVIAIFIDIWFVLVLISDIVIYLIVYVVLLRKLLGVFICVLEIILSTFVELVGIYSCLCVVNVFLGFLLIFCCLFLSFF